MVEVELVLAVIVAAFAGAAVGADVATIGAVLVAAGATVPHSSTPLWPEQAPFLVVPLNAVPSLQVAVKVAAGVSAYDVVYTAVEPIKANMLAKMRN